MMGPLLSQVEEELRNENAPEASQEALLEEDSVDQITDEALLEEESDQEWVEEEEEADDEAMLE